jgi:histone acetyltransferase MYST1
MVAKRKPAIGKHSKKPISGISTPTGSEASKRKGGPKESSVIPAKITDILSVLENSKVGGGITVGHIVEAQPLDIDEFFLGEVVAVKQVNGSAFFYIHFLGEDSKIDDWLPSGRVKYVETKYIEEKLGVKALNAPFFGLSSFSATASASQPRVHIKSVRGVQLGNSVVLRAWYPSPYPEMVSCVNTYVKLCDTCLSYFRTPEELSRHWNYCAFSHPPGTEIYRDESQGISVFEIDGEAFNGYCERLLLLAKLFLREKRACSQDASQYAQVRTFHFYVVCSWDAGTGRAEIVGYFSKLKNPARESHILSCILVLPHHQRKGFGSFLIDLAYEMARIEGRKGSAERPLSELGKLSFYPYWLKRIAPLLVKISADNETTGVTISDLSSSAGIVPDDVVEVLKHYGILKEWATAGVVVVCSQDIIKAHMSSNPSSRLGIKFDPSSLHWTPSYALNPL